MKILVLENLQTTIRQIRQPIIIYKIKRIMKTLTLN